MNPMNLSTTTVVLISVILMSSGCSSTTGQNSPASAETGWQAVHVKTIDGFKVPESTLHSEGSGLVYVSNIDCKPEEYWTDDGKGSIAVIGPNNLLLKKSLIESTVQMKLDAPKGMCILGEHLYFSDNTRLMRCSVSTGEDAGVVSQGFIKANDVVTDGKNIWVSDGDAGKIYCVTPSGKRREIPAPAGVNGITFAGKRLYAVSWTLHDLFEVDPEGKNQPVAFGLEKHFTNLDGIEILHDGTFIVSDFMGNKISTVTPDRSTVKTLVTVTSPADIGLDRRNGLLYVPHFMENKVSVFKIDRH